MTESFGISHIADYLTQMGVKIAHLNTEKHMIELAFHGNEGRWRMIVGIQQSGDVRKLMIIAPHIGTISTQKRLECLEALMAVNYRIAIGKFGLDLEDGEVRLEESIPLADHSLSFEQFRLAFNAITQTALIYRHLLERIVYGDISVKDALKACEQEFFKDTDQDLHGNTSTGHGAPTEPVARRNTDTLPDFNLDDVLAEVTRIFDKNQ